MLSIRSIINYRRYNIMCYDEEHEDEYSERICECCGGSNLIPVESYEEMGVVYREFRCGDCGEESMEEEAENE
jgi:hypothetical protein